MFVVKVMMNKHPSIIAYVVHCLWLQISVDNMQIRISYFFQYLTLENSNEDFKLSLRFRKDRKLNSKL